MGTYTLSHTGKNIDDTLFSAARSVNTTHGVMNVTMFFTNNSNGMKAVINPVTTTSAGVMTPEMYSSLKNIATRLQEVEQFPIECNVEYTTLGINLVFSNNGNEVFSTEIGTANADRAGLMPPIFYDVVEEMYGWGNHAEEGYARIYTAIEPPADYELLMMSVTKEVSIAFDKEQNMLIGCLVTEDGETRYYANFTNDTLGKSRTDYEKEGICIVVGNDMFRHDGTKWVKIISSSDIDPEELIPKEKQDKWDEAYLTARRAEQWIGYVMFDGQQVWDACDWVLSKSKDADELINKKIAILGNVEYVSAIHDALDKAGYDDLSDLTDFLSETPDRISYLYDLSQYKDLDLIKQLTNDAVAKANAASHKVDDYEERVQEVYDALKDGSLKGEKGDKGDQGNSGYSGDISELEIVNNLTQGGATAALSAEMGKYLYEHSNYDIIYEFDWERMTEAEQAAYVREHPNLVVLEGRNPESGGSYFENGTLHLDGSISEGVLTLYSATFSNGTLTL